MGEGNYFSMQSAKNYRFFDVEFKANYSITHSMGKYSTFPSVNNNEMQIHETPMRSHDLAEEMNARSEVTEFKFQQSNSTLANQFMVVVIIHHTTSSACLTAASKDKPCIESSAVMQEDPMVSPEFEPIKIS